MQDEKQFSRRRFFERTSAGLAAAAAGGSFGAGMANPVPAGQTKPPTSAPAVGAANVTDANALKPYRIWDVHTHLFNFSGATIDEKVDECLRFADRMGVERMLVLTSAQFGHAPDAGGALAPGWW